MKSVLVGVFVAAMLAGAAFAGPLEEGYAAAQRGDYATALRLLRPFAEQGNGDAQYNLGLMYERGEGLPQDHAQAARWYHLAAQQGVVEAQVSLGVMYTNGDGVPQDYVLAHMWLNLGVAGFPTQDPRAVAGRAIAVRLRDGVGRLMTPTQIADAQRLAREWKPTPAHTP